MRQFAQSPRAQAAVELIESLQSRFVRNLATLGSTQAFTAVEWLRDEGRHGGGKRYQHSGDAVFNRASVNVSQVHYEDEPTKPLASATALSTIVHPFNPYAPSLHLHLSWTELKSGRGYWRIMADLNPSIPDQVIKSRFEVALQAAAGEHYPHAVAQGDRYFYIPALERHRGISHFYLEAFASGDEAADRELARQVGTAVIDLYPQLLADQIQAYPEPDSDAFAQQLAYHSLYFFQVLTLDRGTTSGLLVHGENDVGILGSLPSQVNPELLRSWQTRLSAPQDELLDQLIKSLPDTSPSLVDEAVKVRLAELVRHHYQRHPDALNQQAAGDVIPPTLDNHSDQRDTAPVLGQKSS